MTPKRRRSFEYLDQPQTPPALRERSHRDIDRANRWLGGSRALTRAIAQLHGLPTDLRILDVGCGTGRELAHVAEALTRRGHRVQAIGLDLAAELLPGVRAHDVAAVCGDAQRLPFPDGSVDIVLASLFLHHFEGQALSRVVAELSRVARRAVVVCDLRRSWIGAAGIWLASFPLRFHPISRHDGVTSVLRGFTAEELHALVFRETGVTPTVERALGYRLVLTWQREEGADGARSSSP